MIVVVALVLTKHGCGMLLVDDQVEEFAADAADEAFGDRASERDQTVIGVTRNTSVPDVRFGPEPMEKDLTNRHLATGLPVHHITVLDAALAQLPAATAPPILVRADTAGCTRESSRTSAADATTR